MAILNQGLLQLYMGSGKGKTTAALGLTWRMLGRGGHVYFCQFLKPADQPTGESLFAQHLAGRLTFERLTEPWDMRKASTDQDQHRRMADAIAAKLDHVAHVLRAGQYDLVVLDEILYCLNFGLVDTAALAKVLDARGPRTELVLTGCDAPDDLVRRADLVTRMQEVKHPFSGEAGIGARPGIEY